MATALFHPNSCRIRSSSHFPLPISTRPLLNCIKCSDSSDSNRGFGSKSRNSGKKETKSSSGKFNRSTSLSSPTTDGKKSYTSPDDLEFQDRLQAVRESALAQKKAEAEKIYGAIDYDAPAQANNDTIGLGTKIGVGVAVLAFGIVFSLGDFLPSGSVTKEAESVDVKISKEERERYENQLEMFEQKLDVSPEDSTALEGAAVTLSEMGEYKKAAIFLQELAKKKPSDPDVFRLLGEVKYNLKDYEGSAAAYRSASIVSERTDFEVLRGLTNALLTAKKPDEAVQFLLVTREQLNKEKTGDNRDPTVNSALEATQDIDTVQVDLLLGKAYSDWGHISDAVSIYDQLISSHPDDFRGYLAKGIILKENGSIGNAERMFIQARFLAPEKAKVLVDKYSRQ